MTFERGHTTARERGPNETKSESLLSCFANAGPTTARERGPLLPSRILTVFFSVFNPVVSFGDAPH